MHIVGDLTLPPPSVQVRRRGWVQLVGLGRHGVPCSFCKTPTLWELACSNRIWFELYCELWLCAVRCRAGRGGAAHAQHCGVAAPSRNPQRVLLLHVSALLGGLAACVPRCDLVGIWLCVGLSCLRLPVPRIATPTLAQCTARNPCVPTARVRSQ